MKTILHTQADLAQNVIERTADAILITNDQFRTIYVNDSFVNMTGYDSNEVLEKSPSILSSELHDDEFYNELLERVKIDGHFHGELIGQKKTLETYTAFVTISTITNEDENITNYVIIARDISKRKEREEHFHSLAFYDALTGLANRRLFEDHLHDSISRAKRHKEKVAIMFIDLDNFKLINDSYGHNVGDLFLKEVTTRIKGVIREEDSLSRIGGDEFTLLLEEIIGLEDAAHAAERIIEQMRKPFEIKKHKFYSAVSLGISIYPDDSKSANELLEFADKAMYHVKKGGKNNFEFYNNKMNQKAIERLELEHELHFAQENNQLELHYQSKTDLHTMQVTCMEALVRWRRPNHGLMSPAGFIPIAEESNLIIEIGSWVLEEACSQASRLNKRGYELTVAVNISPKQINDQHFVTLIKDVLNSSGLEGRHLELEITESALLKNVDSVMEKIETVRALGVKFSIDDFGIGYSSMSYLKQLKIDKLKIDESFIRELSTDSQNRAITSAIIALAKNLDLEVIAEGVETQAQANILKELGCSLAQGYLYSIPSEINSFEASLEKKS